MGLSFNYPFELGDSNGAIKSDIAQLQQDVGDLSQLETGDKSSLVNALNEAMDSTLNGVNRDLTNISDAGDQKLRSLNACANEGELLQDANGLAFVENYAHSTFDASKFTAVGSPVIVDGVMSDCSYNDYTKIPNSVFTNIGNRKWKLKWSGKLPQYGQYPLVIGNNYQNTNSFINVGRFNTTNNFHVELVVNDNGTPTLTAIKYLILNYNDEPNYDGYVEFTGTKYIMGIRIEGQSAYTTVEIDNSNPIMPQSNDLALGYNMRTGSIDLKQFSITVDGVEVFSGNKTGIDTIKPDDYTVVGSPAISADGIASGFADAENVLFTKNIAYKTEDTLDLTCRVKVPEQLPVSTAQMIAGTAVNISDKNVYLGFRASSPSVTLHIGDTNLLGVTLEPYAGQWIKIKAKATPEKLYLTATNDTGNVTIFDVQKDIETPLNIDFTTGWSIGSYLGGSRSYGSSIDLNAFKIYVDGDLVYQPCLKIPYTESKTGSKIVNSIYRDRVNDMAEQFGYANYYTLSDIDFTLPQVELYGLIGQRTLRDSYRNGINYWELYSNRDLEQGGSCTSGVEVTFARPFADTNYVLSVPYSAKSATAFTPTQTGDWIAKGKGIL